MSNPEKYNTIMPESTDRVLCVRVHKVISSEGYEKNFLPHIKTMLEKHNEIRLVIHYENFQGWEYDAAKEDMVAFVELGSKIIKCALVNPPESEVFRRALKKDGYKGEIKLFKNSDLEQAIEWAKAE
jgi:hypothetical protein